MDKAQKIMQKVRRIELTARRRSTATFAGQYRSGFRGQGLEFDDFREYLAGDDPRFIDWKVTARTGSPYVRRFHEEREQALLLAVDASASMRYAGATVSDSKLEYAATLAAVLAYSAIQNGDRVGLLLYGCKPHFYLPPAKGMQQCLRIIREILAAPAGGQDETLDSVVTEILQTQRKSAVIFLISDFLSAPDNRAVGRLNFRHDLIPVRICDEAELHLPDAGRVYLRDPENGELLQVDLSSRYLRQEHSKAVNALRNEWEQVFNRRGIELLDLKTDADFIPPLRRLFRMRSRHISR